MIELGYNFDKKSLNKIKRFKNPTLDILKNKIKKNSNYKIFLNKTQFNNLIKNGMIKYRLTDAKKRYNIQSGDGLADIFKMVLPYAKNILPKLATTVGLSTIGALTSNTINKKMNKKKNDTIIKLNDSQVKKINDNLKKINDSKIFDKKITLEEQEGNGVFSFLLPTLVSLIPSLLSSGKGIKKQKFFFEIKSKYPDLFKRINYPLSNIFINNLLRNNNNFSGCFSKDKIILLDDNKSLIYNLQNSNQNGSHWCSITRKNNTIYVFDSFGIGEIIPEIYKIYKKFNIVTNIYRIQDITSILCGLYSVLFILYDVKTKNDFISFLTLFHKSDFIKNEII